MQEAEIAAGQLIEAREDAPKVLDLADEAFNQMAFSVEQSVVIVRFYGVLLGRDNGFSTTGKDV